MEGVFEGFSGAIDAEHRDRLLARLLESSVLNLIFPAVFAAGALVGIARDVVDAVKAIYHTVTNFGEFIDAVGTFLRLIISPQAAQVGRAIGVEFGRDFGQRLAGMADGNIFSFTYNLGRLIGPTIVYTILAFVGAPEVAASALVERILPLLRPLLERFPRLLRVVEGLAVGLRERAAGTVIGRAQTARRAAAAAAVDRTISTLLARIPAELSAETFTTFEAALQANLATETVGLRDVIAAIPRESSAFRELYEIAFNGMNNRSIWESVLGDIAREAETVGPPFSNPAITSRYSQAVWNLAERRGQAATLIPRPNPIAVVPNPSAPFAQEGAVAPFGRRFLDLGVGSAQPGRGSAIGGHGYTSHLLQDLVVDRAFQQRGRYIDAERFRRLLGGLRTTQAPRGAELRILLWNALYDSQHGLNEPERVAALALRVFGSID
jgi:hypothetical protein